MRRTVLIVSCIGLGLAIIYLIKDLTYPLGNAKQPGPGLYPLVIVALLALGFVGSGIEALVSKSQKAISWPKGAAGRRVMSIIGAVFAYAALLPYLGHAVMGTLLTFIVLQTMKQKSWAVKILLSLGIGLGSYLLFAVVLDIPLPKGSWLE